MLLTKHKDSKRYAISLVLAVLTNPRTRIYACTYRYKKRYLSILHIIHRILCNYRVATAPWRGCPHTIAHHDMANVITAVCYQCICVSLHMGDEGAHWTTAY